MLITKEMLLEKKDELLQRREDLLGEANVCNGALQNIDYWLEVLEMNSPAVPEDTLSKTAQVIAGELRTETGMSAVDESGSVLVTFPASKG